MPIFSISTGQEEKIAETIKTVYKDAYNHPWEGLWFVFDQATSQEVGEKLGISDGSKGQVFVSLLSGYWGWGPKDSWEWLAVKRGPKE